jgi:uncharacterized protein YjbI with pentapeptide repeats
MNELDGTQPSIKQHRSCKTDTINNESGKQALVPQRPASDDKDVWIAYWKEQGHAWRTEPEIDSERQKYLAERQSITPDIEKGIYPFKGIKLSRADVEWLLATHENGRGSVDWSDENQREREGLDLRGADLRQIDLHDLPLTRLYGGLTFEEWSWGIDEQGAMAAIVLEDANLTGAQLQGAELNYAQLRRANLTGAQLQTAEFYKAQLQEARLERAQLQNANLNGANLQNAWLLEAQLYKANLAGAQLQEAWLLSADLEWSRLDDAQLQNAKLSRAQLLNANLWGANVEGAHLHHAIIGNEWGIGPLLADVQWSNTNIAVIDWRQVSSLMDDLMAKLSMKNKGKGQGLLDYRKAVRANRQLAIALQNQGLNEDAARFAYRAQLLQRKVFWYQGVRSLGQYLFSLFLALLTGYGYKPARSFLAYLLVIIMFALAYFIIGRTVGPSLSPVGAWVFSMTSFHGRGFFPGGIKLDDPLTVLAAIEAFVGLLIEVTFIATLTQRLFGK